jgi:hypothetical protein
MRFNIVMIIRKWFCFSYFELTSFLTLCISSNCILPLAKSRSRSLILVFSVIQNQNNYTLIITYRYSHVYFLTEKLRGSLVQYLNLFWILKISSYKHCCVGMKKIQSSNWQATGHGYVKNEVLYKCWISGPYGTLINICR